MQFLNNVMGGSDKIRTCFGRDQFNRMSF